MQITVHRAAPRDADLSIYLVAPGLAGLPAPAARLLRPRIRAKDFTTAKRDLLLLFPGRTGLPARVLFAGVGAAQGTAEWRMLGAAVARRIADLPARRPTLHLPLKPAQAEAFFQGLLLGAAQEKTLRESPRPAAPLTVSGPATLNAPLRRARSVADAVLEARRLANAPASVMHPDALEAEVRALGQLRGVTVEVWDEARLRDERMGCILAVGAGSAHPPRLLIVRMGDGAMRDATVLVGKGVCFDSGGYNLKPTGSMEEMYIDMTGVATVVGALRAVHALGKLPNVVAVFPIVENLVSGAAYKPGDILTARNGLTIEVTNTDAEGRLILADALSLVSEWGPRRIIDLATLTGACMIAVGDRFNGLFSADDALADALLDAGRATDEPLWRLPLHPDYARWMEGARSDLRNTPKIPGSLAGASTAAEFLRRFVDAKIPYAHIDLSAAKPRDPTPLDGIGCSGSGVRMLAEFLRTA